MQVGELVGGPVVTCSPSTDVQTAAETMIALEVGSLAVVRGTDLVGIVTERDVTRLVAEGGDGAMAVGAIMIPDPDTISPDVDLDEAAAWMLAAGYRHLPVVDDGTILGVLSIKDLLWSLTESIAARVESAS